MLLLPEVSPDQLTRWLEGEADGEGIQSLLCPRIQTITTPLTFSEQIHLNGNKSPEVLKQEAENEISLIDFEEKKLMSNYIFKKERLKLRINNDDFKCKYCEKLFSSKSYVKLHEMKTHLIKTEDGWTELIIKAKAEEFFCKVCPIPEKFKTKKNLKNHGKRKHKDINGIIRFDSFVKDCTEDLVQKQIQKMAKCHVCDGDFKCRQDMNVHQKEEHGMIDTFQCEVCPKVFGTGMQWRHHRYAVHGEARFVCKECGKKSKRKHILKIHMKTHIRRDGV